MMYLASVPHGEVVVDLIEMNGTLYVATQKNVYRLVDDKRLVNIGEPND